MAAGKRVWAAVLAVAFLFPVAAWAGSLLVADGTANDVLMYDLTTHALQRAITSTDPAHPFSDCIGVAVDSAGNIYADSIYGNQLVKFDAAGNYLSTLVTGISQPYDVAVDGSGNIYVSDSQVVHKYKPDGTFDRNIGIGVLTTGIAGMAFDRSGNLYVSDASVVREFNPSTGAPINANFATGFSWASGLAFDAGGNLYVADNGNALRIEKFDSTGTLTDTFTNVWTGTGPTIYYPVGLAIDSADNIYVANSYNESIRILSTSGADLGAFVPAYGLPAYPWYIAISEPAAPLATPEPISMIFFGTGLVAVGGFVARRKKQRN